MKLYVGSGLFDDLPRIVPAGRVLLVTTAGFSRRGVTERIRRLLGNRVGVCDSIRPNPDLHDLDALVALHRGNTYDAILAVGGGSVIDAAKVLSVALPASLERPLEHVLRSGNAYAWSARVPVIACPTTAGTGAEVTPFATVWDHTVGKKHSLSDEALFPSAAVLDPLLLLDLPPQETLYTALDTISHALESLWNKHRTPLTELYAIRALEQSLSSLPILREAPESVDARMRMQQGSLLAGLAISQTRTAIAHSISYPLTLCYGVPHGLACSFTLRAILSHLRQRGHDLEVPDALLDEVAGLLSVLDLPNELNRYVKHSDVRLREEQMLTRGRADNFVLPVDEKLLATLLTAALNGADQ